jgi:hypothetical protein
MNLIEDSAAQWQAVANFFDALAATRDRLPARTLATQPAGIEAPHSAEDA